MNKIAIVQARVGSTRLPGKIFVDICGKPLIWHVHNRISRSTMIDRIVFAVPDSSSNDELVKYLKDQDIEYYRGSENNVLERFFVTAQSYHADIIIRITADDPFKDPDVIDDTINLLINNELDFAYNNNPPSFPEGLDVEVFTFAALQAAYDNATSDFDREHVTQYMYKHPGQFKQSNLSNDKDISYLRWTIDEQADLDMVQKVYKSLYKDGKIFKTKDILALIEKKPEIADMNLKVKRSTMYNK